MKLYDRRTLDGVYSVRQSVVYIQNYRYAEERMMRMLAGWIALTPEIAVKLEIATQVYEDALDTDALGRRLPELRATIAAHIEALTVGELPRAKRFVHPNALEAYGKFAADLARFPTPAHPEVLALAKIESQYILKIKIQCGAAQLKVLLRWRKEARGPWLIAGVEDVSNKRSSWSDILDLATADAQVRAKNGNA